MPISKVKIVTITSSNQNSGTTGFIGLTISVDGSIIGSSENIGGGTPGFIKETLITLASPVSTENLTLTSFDIYCEEPMTNDGWLPQSVYIFDNSNQQSENLILGISEWPQNLWVNTGSLIQQNGINQRSYNLGLIGKLA